MTCKEESGFYGHRARVVMGDFNDIKSNDEKQGGPRRAEASFRPFRSMLSICGLQEVKTFGERFTWAGNRHQHAIKSKIDRFLATSTWQDLFPEVTVQMLDWIGSDHRPLLLSIADRKWKGNKLFRYDNRWKYNFEVKQVVQEAWTMQCSYLSPRNFSTALI